MSPHRIAQRPANESDAHPDRIAFRVERTQVRREHAEAFGVWLRCDEAQRYVGCRTLKGFYEWKRRHGVVLHRGRVSRLELDRAIKAVQKPRAMSPVSLANLRKAR